MLIGHHLYCGGNMNLGDVHAVLIDLGAKGKIGAICNAMTPFFKHDYE
jgi:hypothetical protein